MKKNKGQAARLVHSVREMPLKKPRKGALVRVETWQTAKGEVVKYSLTYVNAAVFPDDNGRVLGYDNSHSFHHRHYRGTMEPVTFVSYEALVELFFEELYRIWEEEQ